MLASQNTFDLSRPISVGCDHAGFEYKQKVIELLQKKGYTITDRGTHSADSVDYPDFAHPVSLDVENGDSVCGILLCGSANGVAITANKHQGIRAAICWQTDVARLARQHNNANVICIPARFVSSYNAEEMISIFLQTAFEGGRHAGRLAKMACV